MFGGPHGSDRQGIVVEDDVWIGFGAIVLSGVTIGRGSVIAAGAVVIEDGAALFHRGPGTRAGWSG